jgi:hypothetical protein
MVVIFSAVAAVVVLSGCASHPATLEVARGRPLLGVIRWDMYTGHLYTTQKQELGDFLKPEQYHWRAPFFVRRTGNPEKPLMFNPEDKPEVYQAAMEQEIEFAAQAGLDYWAFGYHGGKKPWPCSLREGLDAYLASPRKNKINFCVIVNCPVVGSAKWYEPPSVQHSEQDVSRDWTTAFVADMLALIKEPSYQHVLGNRPLIYLYMPEFLGEGRRHTPAPALRVERCLRELREQLKAAGVGNPYIAGMINDLAGKWEALYDQGLLDCVTLYHQRYGGTNLQYGTLWGFIKSKTLFGTFKRPDLKVIPPTMSGANGMPRYKVGGAFPMWEWSEPAPGELTAHLFGAFDYVVQHLAKCEAQTAIMYAWNEHSEGGFLCPTMGAPPDYRPVTRQIDELAKALKQWAPPATRKPGKEKAEP